MDLNTKLNSLQEISKAQLSQILNTIPKEKYLVLEPKIIRPLEKVCGVKWLKGTGIQKIFKLEDKVANFGDFPVFFMIYSDLTVFKKVVDQIRSMVDQENPVKDKFHIIIVPRYSCHFERELEELGLLHSTIKLYSYHWLPLYLDKGVLSLELPNVYKHTFLHLDYTLIPPLSRALWKLYFVTGRPKLVLALGEFSNKILKQIDILVEDQGDSDKKDSELGAVIIMDRNFDYPSVLLTPGTYSALLNEVYQVQCGVCEFKEPEEPPDLLEGNERLNPVFKKEPVNFTLDSIQDPVYADIKNRYFTEVTTVLSSLTKQLKTEKIESGEMGLDEIKRYVQTKLQAVKSRKKFLSNHLKAAETIINVLGPRFENQKETEINLLRNMNRSSNLTYLIESLSVFDDKYACLRLFCLICITQKLSETEVRSFWKKFLHQFGYGYSIAFRRLINANFISEPSLHFTKSLQNKIRLPIFNTNEFYTNIAKFKQIPANPEKVNLMFPTCSSYVFGGSYIPLITQLASMLLNATPIEEITTKLGCLGAATLRNEGGFPLQSRAVLIYVIGGVTYAEIAACNLLETLTGSRIVIMSDRIITGNDLMKDILE